MQAIINIDHAVLDDCGITPEQFQEAVSNALGRLSHPVTGEPIYFNGVRVTVLADCPEVAAS